MTAKQKSLKRITALYIVFFIAILASIFISLNPGGASEGFMTSYNDARRMLIDGEVLRNSEIIYELKTSTSSMDFDIPIYSDPQGNLEINARPSSLDIEANMAPGEQFSGNGFAIVFGILGLLAYGAIFVIIFLILTSLRKSIKQGNVFARSNIFLTRAIGILLIAGSLLVSLMAYIESRAAAPYFAGSGLELNTSFPFNFGEIVIGILIFVIAEIFSIGYSLSEEQKLTI